MAFLSVLIAGSGDSWGQFYVSQLRALSRSGAQSGTTVELSAIVGDRLDEVDSLYFSHPGITAQLKTLEPLPFTENRLPDYGHFTVNVADDVPPGRYEARAGGRHGITHPRAFLVTALVNEIPGDVSHDFDSPTPLPVGKLLHLKSTPADVDYFEINIDDGQSLRIEVLAQGLDSRMIGQLALFDSGRHLVARSRGADDVDPLLELDELPAGTYVLAVNDFLYRGGDEFHYQLTAQDSASSVVLLRGARGAPGQLPCAWFVRACCVPDQQPRIAPDQSPAGPQMMTTPGETTRWFADNGDTLHEFNAKKDQQLAIDLVSQRVGQATDARLILQRIEFQPSGPPKLHDILNVDDSQNVGDAALNLRTKDPVALFKAPADARYRVSIRDLDVGRSLSARQQYRLRIRDPDPGFDLVAYRVYPHRDAGQSQPFASKLFRGGSEAIRVLALRRDGWTGAIKVVAEGLPSGVRCGGAIIHAGQNQTLLTLTASEDAASFSGPIRLIGQSDDSVADQGVTAATLVWGRGAGRDFIRSRISTALHLSVSEQDLSPITITLGDDGTADVKKGQSLSLPIKITRREGGKAPCVLRPRDLPRGVTTGEVTIPADKSEAHVELKVTSGTAPGIYSLWLQAETKIKIKPNPQALQRAQQYRSHLQKLHHDPAQAANLAAIKSAITEADRRVEAAQAAAKEQELTVFIPTSSATIRVVDP